MTDKGIALLKAHEGYRSRVYIDTVGVPTGGYGHAFLTGSALPKRIWDEIFWHDIETAQRDVELLSLDLDRVRQDVLINMAFNLGLAKLRRFKRMLGAIKAGDWPRAQAEMLDSRWAKQVGDQPGQRAHVLGEMMLTGKYPNGV